MVKSSISQAVISGIRWSAGVRLLSQISTWAITLIVMRLLVPADYGLVAMASVFVGLAAMLSELGLGMSVVQAKEINESQLRQLFGIILVVQLCIFSFLAFSAPVIATFFSEPRVSSVVQALAVQFIFGAFGVIPDALLKRDLRYKTRSVIELMAAIAASVLTLAFAFSGMGVWSLVVGSLGSQLIKAVMLNVSAPFFKWPRFSLTGMRGHASFGGQLTLTQILGFVFTQIDVFLVGRILGKEALGQYSVGVHLASLPNQRISAIINQVSFPAFARMQDNMAQLHSSVLLGVRMLAIVGFPILWGISSVAPEFVEIVLGTKWMSSVLPLQLLSLVMPLRLIGNFLPNATQAVGRPDVFLKNYVFATLIMAPAFAVGIQFGLIGVCMAWVIAFPIVFLQSAVRNLRTLGIRVAEFMRMMAPAVLASVIMYASVWCTRYTLQALLPIGALLFTLIVVGGAAYALSVWLVSRDALREALNFTATIAGRKRGGT